MVTKFHIDKSTTWWVTAPVQRKKSITTSFTRDFGDFIRHISMPCYAKIADKSYGFGQRTIWFGVHAFFAFVLVLFLSDAWVEFAGQYFATTLYDPLYPIERVPFPAVSICSNNRISRRAAEALAEELSKVDPSRRNVTFFVERIKLLGLLYNKEMLGDIPNFYQFQDFLDIYDTAENESYFNTLRKLGGLTPPCSELLLKCSLSGSAVDCLTNTTFQTTLTSYGYCCTFNGNDIYNNRNYKSRFSHSDLGLVVMLNTSNNDIHFPLLRIDSTIVMIHPAYKYPEPSSGGTIETFITNGEDNYLSVQPYLVDSVPVMRQFSPRTRNCYFKDEHPDIYVVGRFQYSFNNCITQCRIRSTLVLCNCLPFNMPYEFTPNGTKTVYCTLRHLDCLQRYRFKWRNVLSQRKYVPGLEREIEDALYCPQCLPACDNIVYNVMLNTLPVQASLTNDLPPHDPNDITVLRVFFSEAYVRYYRQIVRNSWFEAFSTVGNYCGIIIGFSLIVAMEVLYFIGRQIILLLMQGLRNGQPALTIYP